jgi:hypothetical protein
MSDARGETIVLKRDEIRAFYLDVNNVFSKVDALLEDNYKGRNKHSSFTVRCLCELYLNAHVLEEYLDTLFPDLEETEEYQVPADFVSKLSKVAITLYEIKLDLRQENISLESH